LEGAHWEEPKPEGHEAEDQVPPGAGFDSKRVTGQAREKPGRRSLYANRRRSVAEQDDSAHPDSPETSLRHDKKQTAKSANRRESLDWQ